VRLKTLARVAANLLTGDHPLEAVADAKLSEATDPLWSGAGVKASGAAGKVPAPGSQQLALAGGDLLANLSMVHRKHFPTDAEDRLSWSPPSDLTISIRNGNGEQIAFQRTRAHSSRTSGRRGERHTRYFLGTVAIPEAGTYEIEVSAPPLSTWSPKADVTEAEVWLDPRPGEAPRT
jgi:hypothetical protein